MTEFSEDLTTPASTNPDNVRLLSSHARYQTDYTLLSYHGPAGPKVAADLDAWSKANEQNSPKAQKARRDQALALASGIDILLGYAEPDQQYIPER